MDGRELLWFAAIAFYVLALGGICLCGAVLTILFVGAEAGLLGIIAVAFFWYLSWQVMTGISALVGLWGVFWYLKHR